MLKHLIKFSGITLLLFLVACGGNTETAVEPELQVEDAAIHETEASDTVEVTTEEEIVPVAAKPQLVEFYADW